MKKNHFKNIFSTPFFTKKKLFFGSFGVVFLLFLSFLIFDFCFPFRKEIKYSTVVMAKDSTILETYLSQDSKWRMKTEIFEISPELRKALIFKEDKYFYYHIGVDFFALLRASIYNFWYWKKTSGASTITMQVARMLERKPRTYFNKIFEIIRAFQLEWHYSKDEILQMYFNLVPYGSNVEGIKSAAWLFFQKNPSKLTLSQVITLMLVPNRPNSWALGKKNEKLLQARNQWLKKLEQKNQFTTQEINIAFKENLPQEKQKFHIEAPHFARRMKNLFPDKDLIYTTLNRQKQAKIQQLTANFIERTKFYNIHQAAVLVVNNQSNEVEAYIGSSDFWDKKQEGEVDGIKAIRSPGSTFKPLIYALAFEKGWLTPKMILEDVPTDFAGYVPENFSKNFSGKVSVENALIRSLNIPAVKVLQMLSPAFCIQKLIQMNFKQIQKDEKKLGLSLALGGAGTNLEELVNLYKMFAHQGEYEPFYYLKNQKKEFKNTKKTKILEKSSAYLITEILSNIQRPDLPNGAENSISQLKIAWKTGTSLGRRDAWCIAYNPKYTVGVWIGNFSGEGANNLTGAEVATPLMIDIFKTLTYNQTNEWFVAPNNIKPRYICTETGLLPNVFCDKQILDNYISGISSLKKCEHLKEIWVNDSETISFCGQCLPKSNTKKVLFPNETPEMMSFLVEQGQKIRQIPIHNPNCKNIQQNTQKPRIISPSPHKEYLIEAKNPPELLLTCQVSPWVSKVHWYINDKFLISTSPQKSVFFKPEIGIVKIACADEQGNTTEIKIKVSGI